MKTDTHVVNIGGIEVGGSNPIIIQSMTDTDTSDIVNTVSQIEELYNAGSQIVRGTVNNTAAAKAIEEIKTNFLCGILAKSLVKNTLSVNKSKVT